MSCVAAKYKILPAAWQCCEGYCADHLKRYKPHAAVEKMFTDISENIFIKHIMEIEINEMIANRSVNILTTSTTHVMVQVLLHWKKYWNYNFIPLTWQ